ncbi:Protein of unknown function, partial [Gryllus bimaculatus]
KFPRDILRRTFPPALSERNKRRSMSRTRRRPSAAEESRSEAPPATPRPTSRAAQSRPSGTVLLRRRAGVCRRPCAIRLHVKSVPRGPGRAGAAERRCAGGRGLASDESASCPSLAALWRRADEDGSGGGAGAAGGWLEAVEKVLLCLYVCAYMLGVNGELLWKTSVLITSDCCLSAVRGIVRTNATMSASIVPKGQ